MSNWDLYFREGIDWIASNSKCLSVKRGAIITREHSIVSTGYNGPPSGIEHCADKTGRGAYVYGKWQDSFFKGNKCPRQLAGFGSSEGLYLCPAAHAEQNAIANAARLGHMVKGCVLYTHKMPCRECSKNIINSGIIEVVVIEDKSYEDNLKEISGRDLLIEAKIKIREFCV